MEKLARELLWPAYASINIVGLSEVPVATGRDTAESGAWLDKAKARATGLKSVRLYPFFCTLSLWTRLDRVMLTTSSFGRRPLSRT